MRSLALLLAALIPAMAAAPPDADKGKIVGNPSAPMLMELYSDFLCPHCKTVHEEILPSIILDYVRTGKACLVFREFPLAIPGHVYSRPAAYLATAAARIGKYQEVTDALFKNQMSWGLSGKVWETVAPVLTPGEQKRVQTLANDPAVKAEVQRDYDSAQRAGLNQTPTLLITYKGRRTPWVYWNDYNLFKSFVNDLLKK